MIPVEPSFLVHVDIDTVLVMHMLDMLRCSGSKPRDLGLHSCEARRLEVAGYTSQLVFERTLMRLVRLPVRLGVTLIAGRFLQVACSIVEVAIGSNCRCAGLILGILLMEVAGHGMVLTSGFLYRATLFEI